MLAFSVGLTAISVAGGAGSAALMLIVTNLISLIPMVLSALAQGIVDFITMLAANAPVMEEATITMISSMLNAIVTLTPQIVVVVMLVSMYNNVNS